MFSRCTAEIPHISQKQRTGMNRNECKEGPERSFQQEKPGLHPVVSCLLPTFWQFAVCSEVVSRAWRRWWFATRQGAPCRSTTIGGGSNKGSSWVLKVGCHGTCLLKLYSGWSRFFGFDPQPGFAPPACIPRANVGSFSIWSKLQDTCS